jgi:hypothetical protein
MSSKLKPGVFHPIPTAVASEISPCATQIRHIGITRSHRYSRRGSRQRFNSAEGNASVIRYAPQLSTEKTSGPESGPHPYTVDVLAKFLGFVRPSTQKPTDSFVAAFGAEELIADGIMKESQIRGLSAEKLGELVIAMRKQRDAMQAI